MAKEINGAEDLIQEEDLQVGEASAMEADVDDGVYVHKFSKPVVFEDKTVESLTFNFEKLTGRDVRMVSRELKAAGLVVLMKSVDDDFLTRFAARAIEEKDIDVDIFDAMPCKDFNKIVSVARRFL